MATSSTAIPSSQPHATASATRSSASIGREEFSFDFTAIDNQYPTAAVPHDPSLEHNGKRSLSSISLQAFGLGFALAVGLIFSLQLASRGDLLWRLFAFISCLSLFHFLEFWTTARYNLPEVQANSFLLFTNGAAYNIAYGLALVEILLSTFSFKLYAHWMTSSWSKLAGLLLVLVCQAVRSVAMAQAGTNFNHIPQKTRKQGHVLVTNGVYGWLRHPSYFGFFWWAIGTQLLVGNKFCLLGYALVLWRFFSRRIVAEERTLVEFFENDYVTFRSKTPTGIPLIK